VEKDAAGMEIAAGWEWKSLLFVDEVLEAGRGCWTLGKGLWMFHEGYWMLNDWKRMLAPIQMMLNAS
jgi:hypothetical protein